MNLRMEGPGRAATPSTMLDAGMVDASHPVQCSRHGSLAPGLPSLQGLADRAEIELPALPQTKDIFALGLPGHKERISPLYQNCTVGEVAKSIEDKQLRRFFAIAEDADLSACDQLFISILEALGGRSALLKQLDTVDLSEWKSEETFVDDASSEFLNSEDRSTLSDREFFLAYMMENLGYCKQITENDIFRVVLGQLFEVTDFVKKLTGQLFLVDAVAPEGYAFQDPDREKPKSHTCLLENLSASADKVAVRKIAEEIGILNNPRYLDVRSVNSPSSTASFTGVKFPKEELLSAIEKQEDDSVIIWENLYDGFAVFKIRGKQFAGSLHSNVSELMAESELNVPNEQIDRNKMNDFLESLSDCYLLQRTLLDRASFWHSTDHQSNFEKLAGLLATSNTRLYVKGARGSGGDGVYRVERAGEDLTVQSLSPAFRRTVEQDRQRVREALKVPFGTSLESPVSRLDPYHRLSQLCNDDETLIENPIVEEEIPMASCDQGRAEPRIIFQVDPESKSVERVAGYCKYSKNGFAANRSLGGTALSIDAAIEYILNDASCEPGELQRRTSEIREELFLQVDEFAKKFFEKDDKRLGGCFAVDVAFVWSGEKLEFYLVEVQRQFGYAGLKEVDPEKAAKVEQLLKAHHERMNTPERQAARKWLNAVLRP